MLRAWKIGRFLGIDLYVHWTFLLLPLIAIFGQHDGDAMSVPVIFALFTLFGCIILHEYGHALMARRFGIATRDITLYVIGGVARMEKISEKPWEEFWVALAGPAVNVAIMMLLALFAATVCIFAPNLLMTATPTDWIPTSLGLYLAGVFGGNLVLVVFNMAPAFPMDGGRVFRAVLSMWLGQLQATRIAANVSVVVTIVGAGLLFLWSGSFMIFVVGLFVLMAGRQELRYVEWRHSRRGRDEDEAIPAIPGAPSYRQPQPAAAQAFAPLNGLIFQPRVAVYVWDSDNGIWVREANRTPPPRLSET